MKYAALAILIFINVQFASAQNEGSKKRVSLNENKLSYNLSYFGNNLWNPGLKAGSEYVLLEKVKTKTWPRKNLEKIKTHQLLLSGNLGFYWDPRSHVGVISHFGFVYRKIKTRGFNYNIGLSPLSYYRSFLPETYKVSNDEEVKKIFLPGRGYYAPTFSFGLGKVRKEKRLEAWFLNLNITILTPYNGDILPLLSIEYGYRFSSIKKKN